MEKSEPTEPKLSDNALAILEKRYFRKDPDNNIAEDWKGLCQRVTSFIVQAEEEDQRELWEKVFFEMMYQLEFLPNSPTLFNADMPLGNLSACFVLPVEDSLEEIYDTLKNAAIIFASGGGCGYDFSELRKRGSRVSRTSGVSSGPVSFIYQFNTMTDVIKQGGKRRGANMGVLRIDHPDIEEFIDAKTEEGTLANFNLSVAITDDFMRAVDDDRMFVLYDRYLGAPDREINARSLFNKIVAQAWSNGEPGVLFIDEINRRHPLKGLGDISGTNPCSEQPLLPNESCNLGSINLTKFYKDFGVDWEGLAEAVAIAVRFLDDVISVNKYPVSAIKEASLRTRKIGLGVMGWADLLLMLGIRYDSEEAVALAGKMMERIEFHALQASVNLAKERGSFPAFSDHYDDSFFDFFPDSTYPEAIWEELQDQIAMHGLRNACVTTIAPTGSLSLIAGVSSGIEPNFQWEYTYHRVDTEFSERHSLAARYLDAGEKLAEHFVTALDIEPIWHIRMQAAWQLWLDSGISKTINLPYEASKKDVREAIREAWRRGCKGITLYRSGSRQQEVLVAKAQSQSKVSEKAEVISPRERPGMTSGSTMKIPVGDTCGTMFVTVNSDEVGPCESFVMLGRGGGCISSYAEALGRTISLALRSGVDPREIIDQLSGIRCSKVRWAEGGAIRSCPDAVAYALSSILGIGSFAKVNSNSEAGVFNPHEPTAFSPTIVSFGENPECPECGMMLSIEGRCLFCRACGYSKCG